MRSKIGIFTISLTALMLLMVFTFVATNKDSGRKLIGQLPSKLSPCRPNVFLDICMVSFIENYLATPGDPLNSADYQIRKDLELALKKYEAPRIPAPPAPRAFWGKAPAMHVAGMNPPRQFHQLLENYLETGDYGAAVAEIHSLNATPLETRQLPPCTECICCYPPRFDSVHEFEFKKLYGHIPDEELLDLSYDSNRSSLDSISNVAIMISREKGPAYLSKLNIKSCSAGPDLTDCLREKIIKDVSDFIPLISNKQPMHGIPKAEVYLAMLDAALGKPAEVGNSLQVLTPQEQAENRLNIQKLMVTSLYQTDCTSGNLRDAYHLTGLQDHSIITNETYGLDDWQYLEVECMADKGNYVEKLRQMTDEEMRSRYATALGPELRWSDKHRPINFTPLELLPFADANGRKEIYQNFILNPNTVIDEKTRTDLKAELLETDKYFQKGQYDGIILPYLRMMVILDPNEAIRIWKSHRELYDNDFLVVEAAQIFAGAKDYDRALQVFFSLPVERRKELAPQLLSLIPTDLIDVQTSDLPDKPDERAKLYGMILEKEYTSNWFRQLPTPESSKVSRYLYKSKSPFLIFTCKTLGFGCG